MSPGLAVVPDRRPPATPSPSRGANAVVLALVVALTDLELARARGKVPSPLRSKNAA
jgi:hypothetical protein